MELTTRFGNGVTNRAIGEGIGAFLPDLDPTKYVKHWDDFVQYVAAVYTITETGAGGTTAATDGHGGLLLLTCDSADNDNQFVQTVEESFRWASTRKLWFEGRFQTSDATQSDIIMGLVITDTSPLDATDGIFFLKADGSTTVNLIIRKDSSDTTIAAATLANTTNIKLGFTYNGRGLWEVWRDGVVVGSSTVTSTAPDDEDLSVCFGIQNGEAVAKTMTVDYVLAVSER